MEKYIITKKLTCHKVMSFQAFPWWRWHRRICVKIKVMANICFTSWGVDCQTCQTEQRLLFQFVSCPVSQCWTDLSGISTRLLWVAIPDPWYWVKHAYAWWLHSMLAIYVSYLLSGLTSLTPLMNDWVWVVGVAGHQASWQTPTLDFISGKLIRMTLSRVGITQSI